MGVREASVAYVDVAAAADAAPPGYKLTEVGVIPEDWGLESIRELGTIKTGPFGTALKASEYSEVDGVPLISVGEIREGFFRISDHTPRVSPVVTQRLPQYLLRKGDIVLGRKGGVERSALVRHPQQGWFLGSDGIRIRPASSCHDEYLALQFRSARVRGWLLQNAIGTTMPSLNEGILGNVAVPLPATKAEQEAIAEALSDADALIESLQQLIAKKRQIKQGAMQALLTGQQRLPGYTGAWIEVTLGDLGKCHRGVSYNPDADLTAFDTKSSVRLLRSNNVQDAKIVFADVQYVNSSRVSSDQQLRDGDILICMANGSRELVGKAGSFASRDGFGYTFGAFMSAFRPHQDVGSKEFAFYLFQTEAYRNHISILLAGSSINNLTPTSIEALSISVPESEDEQTAIAAVLSDMDAEITALEARLSKTREIKQGMMQALLTGAIRLPLTEAA